MDRFVRHIRPEERTIARKHHALQLRLGSELLAEARMEYFGKPFPFYYLGNIFTSGVHQQQGIAGNLVEKVNGFLETRGKTGILYNGISPHLKAHGMYERRGWTPISGRPRWLIYNPAPRVTEEMMHRAVDQIDRHDE